MFEIIFKCSPHGLGIRSYPQYLALISSQSPHMMEKCRLQRHLDVDQEVFV